MITRIHDAVAALRAGGVRANRGYPQGMQMVLEDPVAAVTVDYADRKKTALKVSVFAAAHQGGRVCEDLAQTVARILRGENASCSVGTCQFDRETGLFSVEVLAVWQEFLADQVWIGEEWLPYVTDFSAVQTTQVETLVDEETGEVTVGNQAAGWTLTIQELLPVGDVAVVDPTEPFALTVYHENCVETYPQCYWHSITLEETNGSVIRKRVAQSEAERVME